MTTLVHDSHPARPAVVGPGASAPIGPTVTPDGVNLCVYSQRATSLDLLLFDDPAEDAPSRVVTFDPDVNRTGGYWHAFVPGVRAGQVYAFRATGPWAPEAGLRFDERHVLLDPYGRGVAVPAAYRRDTGEPTAGHVGRAMKSVVVDLSAYDWEGDRPLIGSPDIYVHANREPQKTVNFVTCHDGFTLADLVAYDEKHNEANGEDNRDGSDQNLSWNCGVEGPTDDPAIRALRRQQARNLIALNLLAVGVPMLTMGDEVLRTQGGNNNAYCQDGELSWFDWTATEREAGMLRFARTLIAARRRAQVLLDLPSDVTLAQLLVTARIDWHGIRLGQPDRSDDSRSLAFTVWGRDVALHMILNAYWEGLEFELPPGDDGPIVWRRILDTTLESPDDILEGAAAPIVDGATYRVGPRSAVVLATRTTQPESAR